MLIEASFFFSTIGPYFCSYAYVWKRVCVSILKGQSLAQRSLKPYHLYNFINGHAWKNDILWVRKELMSLMLIIIKEIYDVSIFQPLNNLGFKIHNCKMWILMTYYIMILQLWTLFKMFKTCFLKFEFLALFFWLCFQFWIINTYLWSLHYCFIVLYIESKSHKVLSMECFTFMIWNKQSFPF